MRNLRPLRLLIGACLALFLASGSAAAGNNNNDGNNDAGGTGRTDSRTEILNSIPLTFENGQRATIKNLALVLMSLTDIPVLALVEASMVEVESVDKLDLSGVPLFGDLVGPEFGADDMTEENRIGNVFRGREDTIYVALNYGEQLLGASPGLSRIVLFNDRNSYEVKPLTFTLNIDGQQMDHMLDELAQTESVRLLNRVGLRDGPSVVLGGLRETDYDVDIPNLGDLPKLRSKFIGTAHGVSPDTLLLLIRPSILQDGG